MFESLETFLNTIPYGKHSALTAVQLYELYLSQLPIPSVPVVSAAEPVEGSSPLKSSITPISLEAFKRMLRTFSHNARLKGHWVIGDDLGYYLALSKDEWNAYRNRRLSAIRDELTSFANCDRISVADFIKLVYHINVHNPNYEMELH